MSKALSLLDCERIAYNTKEHWIDVAAPAAERALELLKTGGIEAQMRPAADEVFRQLLDQLVIDLQNILRELDGSRSPSFASVMLTRLNAIEGRLKRLEQKR